MCLKELFDPKLISPISFYRDRSLQLLTANNHIVTATPPFYSQVLHPCSLSTVTCCPIHGLLTGLPPPPFTRRENRCRPSDGRGAILLLPECWLLVANTYKRNGFWRNAFIQTQPRQRTRPEDKYPQRLQRRRRDIYILQKLQFWQTLPLRLKTPIEFPGGWLVRCKWQEVQVFRSVR